MKHPACVTCARPMRTKSMDASKYPGTRVHAARGLCGTCYEAARTGRVHGESRGPNRATRSHGSRPTVEQLLAERDRFNEARRNRGVPTEGVRGTRCPVTT